VTLILLAVFAVVLAVGLLLLALIGSVNSPDFMARWTDKR